MEKCMKMQDWFCYELPNPPIPKGPTELDNIESCEYIADALKADCYLEGNICKCWIKIQEGKDGSR
jgi:hypothetical protein